MLASPSLADSPSIKIGALLPLTGEFAAHGEAFKEGMQIAAEEINAKGGIGGAQIDLIFEDPQNLPPLVDAAAKKLVSIDRVQAAVTCTYIQTMVGGKQFERAKIPTIALWDSSPEIDAAGEYLFAIGPWTPASGEVAAEYAFEQLNAKRAVVIHTVEPWAEAVSKYFAKRFTDLGGNVVETYPVNPDVTDFRTILAKSKSQQPDVLYAPLTQSLVPIAKQMKQLRIPSTFLTSDVISPEFISQAPEAFENTVQTMIQDPSGPVAQELLTRYRLRFHKPPLLPWDVSTGYDAVKLIGAATMNSDRSSLGIQKGLMQLKSFPGTLGNITFSAEGSWPQIPSIFRVQRGQMEFVWSPNHR